MGALILLVSVQAIPMRLLLFKQPTSLFLPSSRRLGDRDVNLHGGGERRRGLCRWGKKGRVSIEEEEGRKGREEDARSSRR